MPSKFLIVNAVLFLFCFSMMSQNDDTKNNIQNPLKAADTIEVRDPIDPLSPAKAAFYSAVLPGLGQAYNKKYWKIPLVYGALGTGIYFYVTNKKDYDRYRDAYKRRLAGFSDDEFNGRVTLDGLQRAQKFYRKNKEVALLVTIGIYALNIIDANVDAHLLQYNVDENLTLSPHFKYNEIDRKSNLGLTLNFKF
ncbi:DUF5683 domain-containing protein [Yeosuana marina]|uniref:DUF5683 domain-containing protein n=1 Tax=Yeosuana marina TaxID=1565536 RepID=UPI0014217C8D|nr:DUF5683 domain-containing protein [Yeosuana marina]